MNEAQCDPKHSGKIISWRLFDVLMKCKVTGIHHRGRMLSANKQECLDKAEYMWGENNIILAVVDAPIESL